MIRYTRKQINQQVDQFKTTEFYNADDVDELVEHIASKFIAIALEAGADSVTLEKGIQNEKDIN